MEVLFQTFPYRCASFFCNIIKLGFVTALALAAPTIYIIYTTWSDDDDGDGGDGNGNGSLRYLRIWTMIRLAAFFVQLPTRRIMYTHLKQASQEPLHAHAVATLHALCRSRAWRINQMIGIFLHIWFASVLTLLFATPVNLASPLVRIVIVNVTCFFVHMVVTYVWLFQLVTMGHNDTAYTVQRRAILDEAIHKNSRVYSASHPRFTANNNNDKNNINNNINNNDGDGDVDDDDDDDDGNNPTESCTICWAPYEKDDQVRVLLCDHHFHMACIDQWLVERGACPYCSAPIVERKKYI